MILELQKLKAAGLRPRIVGLCSALVLLNLAVGAWAFFVIRGHPMLSGAALLAYGLGLRHAVDADHIAAIDNVTRKLMEEGKRPTTTGLFFSLGHSTVVVLGSVAAMTAATIFAGRFTILKEAGEVIGTMVSILFLLTLGAINSVILISTLRDYKKRANRTARSSVNRGATGFLARLLRPLFQLVRHSWHMYPLGFLFGLGFDTATEVGLLGLSATQASHGLAIGSVLVLPALFAAGMALVDSVEGMLMLGAYGWAFDQPERKLYYNAIITALSVIVAIVVAGIEALGLAADRFNLDGRFWSAIGAVNSNFPMIGYLIVGVFLLGWGGSVAVYRRNKRSASS